MDYIMACKCAIIATKWCCKLIKHQEIAPTSGHKKKKKDKDGGNQRHWTSHTGDLTSKKKMKQN